MSAPKEILRLIDQFELHLDSYKSGQYNEAQLRREFLDPFFKALGWDVDNTQGLAEAYKDVVHEDAIRIGGAVKAPDYCFRIGGTRKFFLEAKKPSVDVGEETSAAYQLRRYAWSAKLPLSILSDFEEFAVYDCRIKPNKPDSASTARVFICRFRDYDEKWEWISSIFSKDAVLKGSFDKYAETNKAKRGTAEVDDDFLATIEHWRSELARILALRNSRLSQRELNFAVQRIIDRIIFLRISEDRGIEAYGRLLALTNGPNIYPRLCEIFEDADTKYNSGLFYFKTEKGRHEPPDELTLSLDVDDKLLHDLLKGLYYPESPYEFTVISSDILGHVYEQFLGKVIRLTAGHHAVVEDKPEVKKAGGVYYTPTYIVDYIVRQTVGKLVEDKTPKQVAKLRVLDPACGSGSFLINAYQFLLDWHRDWYIAHKPEGWTKGRNPVLVQTTSGWKLTIAERKRILLGNIYGVDIDPQAVEVTKLSLLLKVLEGESEQTIQPFLRLFQERALPDLGENIKCGNSLIGPDFYQQKELPFLSDDERLRVNVFDWAAEFPEIMKSGGFDTVIGNPPYVQSALIIDYKDYFKSKFSTYSGSSDLYVFFVEQGFRILEKDGKYGMIISNKWLKADYGLRLRKYLSCNVDILQIVDFGELPVFKRVGVFPCIVIGTLRSSENIGTKYTPIKELPPKHDIQSQIAKLGFQIEVRDPQREHWALVPKNFKLILEKIKKDSTILRDCSGLCIRRGVVTGFNTAFIINEETKDKLIREDSSATELLKPFISGDETRRYSISWQGRYVIFTRRGINILKYPSIFSHLFQWKKQLEPRKTNVQGSVGRKPGIYKWFEIQDSTSYYQEFDKTKIVYGQFQIAPHFCFSSSTLYFGSNHYMMVHDNERFLKYLLGILNSKLYFFYMKSVAGVLGDIDEGGRLISQKSHILKFPVHKISFSDPGDVARQNRMVTLVEQMLDLHEQLSKAKTPHEKETIQRQIDAVDKQIDQLVYHLYGLTEQEIKIVEAAN